MRHLRGLRAGWPSDERLAPTLRPNYPQQTRLERDRLPPNTPSENKAAMRAEAERLVAAYRQRETVQPKRVQRAYVNTDAGSMAAQNEANRWAAYRALELESFRNER